MGWVKGCFFLSICILFISCNQNESNEGASNSKENAKSATMVEPGSIDGNLVNMLWTSCDNVDIIFYEHPVSVSQNHQAGIRSAIQYISTQPAKLNPNCKAIGRLSFFVQGEIKAEADIHISEGCAYFTFIENQKVIAANNISPQGIQFFYQVLNSSVPTGDG